MPSISDVRALLYARLKVYADAQNPALRIQVDGKAFAPNDAETFLRFALITAKPSKPYAGTNYLSQERGLFQVEVVGPESRLQKAFETVAWAIREHFWASGSAYAPTLGTDPLVRLGPVAPHVVDHPAPGEGRLGSIVTIEWNADFARS